MRGSNGYYKRNEKFANACEPGHLEDVLNIARECGDESSKDIAKNLISNAEKIIIDKLNNLLFASSWDDNSPAEIENCLISASKLIDFGTSKSSDIADLCDRVSRRRKDEKAIIFEKDLYKVFKKHAKRKGDKA